MKNFKTLDDFSATGKTVLLRVDLNVPIKDGVVTDHTRIDRAVPTIRDLVKQGARVVLLSHFGRPKGKEALFSLKPLVPALAESLKENVQFCEDCVGPMAETAIAALPAGGVLLLENVRFYPEEEKDDAAFAARLAALGDVYVNDAFSAAHRAHASTHGLARLLPAYAGRLMEAELNALTAALGNPQRPVVAIVGGAKVSTKLDLLNNLVSRIDILVLGGGMANTFLFAQGHDVGKSLCEKDMADTARGILKAAAAAGCQVILPVDAVTAKEFKAHTPTMIRKVTNIAVDDLILDIGPETVSQVIKVLTASKTLVWNGPMGAFETPPFAKGTLDLAKAVADLTVQGKVLSVGGGGDTVAALAQANVLEKMSYVSTAGGAFLEWMEGKELPGVQALINTVGSQSAKKAAG